MVFIKHELAIQTLETVNFYCEALHKNRQFPLLKTMLCIGGVDTREQLNQIRE